MANSADKSSLIWDSSGLATVPHSSTCILLMKIYLFVILLQRKFRNFILWMWRCGLFPTSSHVLALDPHMVVLFGEMEETLGLWPINGKFWKMRFEGGWLLSGSDSNSPFYLASIEKSSPHTPVVPHPPWPTHIKELILHTIISFSYLNLFLSASGCID